MCIVCLCIIHESQVKPSSRFQEVFAKKDNRAKDIRTSTHLICPSAEGDKYRAAVKWGVPAITRDWLIECIRTGEREPEDWFKVDNKNRREVNYKEVIRDLILKGAVGGVYFLYCLFLACVGLLHMWWTTRTNGRSATRRSSGVFSCLERWGFYFFYFFGCGGCVGLKLDRSGGLMVSY